MNKTMLVSIILLTALLTSCTGGTTTQGQGSPFIGGTTGVTITFEQGQPPAEVSDTGIQSFSITIRSENKGEYDVPQNKTHIAIRGLSASLFNTTDAKLIQNSAADLTSTKRLPTGDVQEPAPILTEFSDLNYKGKVTGLEQTYPIQASICYEYKNTAQSSLCVRKNLITPKTGGVCEVPGDKEVYNSGGPIQISNMKTMARSQNSLGFTFTINHAGTGTLYKITSACNEQQRADEGKILIKVGTGIAGLTCTGLSDTSTEGTTYQGTAKYLGTPLTITCTQLVDNLNDYVQPITITTEYDYQETTSTTIKVKSATN